MVEPVIVICCVFIHFYWTWRIFFVTVTIDELLSGESWLSLMKGKVWSVRSTNDQPVLRAPHSVTISDKGRTKRKWTETTARKRRGVRLHGEGRGGKTKEEVEESKDTDTFLMKRATILDHVLNHDFTIEAGWRMQLNVWRITVNRYVMQQCALYCNTVYLM